ncbi:hypothetical protein [Xanthomonas dyei]|uniref:hypothetical protein n=1 Tax=Xanthomonas dyei TaxID=743699 RepID=UPI001E480322|nr:hypothetical protein [Xanthomonas dyei]MCC4635599.1 hypothetical protein [Xanthomonas dyei pv. eucalypti]
MLEPSDVFTPGQIPIRPTNIYSRRGTTEDDFEKYIRWKMMPIVFGEYGVGKTSLVRHQFKDRDKEGRLVNIESVASKTMQDVFDRVLEKLDYAVVRKNIESSSSSSAIE